MGWGSKQTWKDVKIRKGKVVCLKRKGNPLLAKFLHKSQNKKYFYYHHQATRNPTKIKELKTKPC